MFIYGIYYNSGIPREILNSLDIFSVWVFNYIDVLISLRLDYSRSVHEINNKNVKIPVLELNND